MFSEKKAVWLQSVQQINEGDIFEGKVNRVTDFGAFVDLCFSDGEHLHVFVFCPPFMYCCSWSIELSGKFFFSVL